MPESCPEKNCIHWDEDDKRCRLRRYETTDYGCFLQGYECIRDADLEDRCLRPKKPVANIGETVYYYSQREHNKGCGFRPDKIEYSSINDFIYIGVIEDIGWHQDGEDGQNCSYYFTDDNSCQDNYDNEHSNIFLTREECIEAFTEIYNKKVAYDKEAKTRRLQEAKGKVKELEEE